MTDKDLTARLNELANKLIDGKSTKAEDAEFDHLYSIFQHVEPIGR